MLFRAPFPSPSDHEVVKAELVSLEVFATSRGDRLYGLFQLQDGKTIGIWTSTDDLIYQLKPGDKALFRHHHGSSYEFIAKAI